MEYIVYFELYGKKMKTTVNVETLNDVKEKIFNNIIFHKIVEKKSDIYDDDTFNNIMNLFNMKK